MLKKDKTMVTLNNFFVRNWWFNGISNLLIIILLINYSFQLDEVRFDFKERLNKATQNIIYGTPDGRIGLLDKQLISTDNQVFQNSIALMAKNFNASKALLTQGFDEKVASTITKPSNLMQTNEKFALLYQEYFDNKNVALSFFNYYYSLLKLGDIAVKSEILATSYTFKPINQNEFEILITFKTLKDFINRIDNKDTEIIVDDIYQVRGYIDPTKYSTSLNPFGVRFTDVKMQLFTYKDFISKLTGQQ